jgi:HEAT repeat protein
MQDTSIEELIQTIILDNSNNTSSDFENAYMMLLELGEATITPLIVSLQSDEHNQHHIIASILCDILVEVGDNDALELLNQLVYDPRNEVFTPVVRAIAQFKLPQINPILCELLDHPAPQARRVVAWQLGRNEATEAFSTLATHLDEIDIETLRGIIWSLGRIGDYRSIHLIEPFTKHLSDDIAFIAKEAVERIANRAFDL